MSDISKEFLDELQNEFNKRYLANKKIKSLTKKLTEGTATAENAFDYAKEVGNLRKLVLHNLITEDILTDGYLGYYNALDIFTKALYDNYELINNYCKSVFTQVNKRAGINLKGVSIEYDQDKTDGIIECAVKGKYADTRAEIEEAVATNAKSYYDASVRKNAEFQYKSGLSPKIIRTAVGKTCKWCQSLAGTYDYYDVSDTGNDVFRRHSNCDCVVVYSPKKGRKQNVWTKEWENNTYKRIKYSLEKEKRYEDVTKLYFGDATPKKGKIDYDKNYSMGDDTINERRNLNLIHKIFGGDIFAIEHTNYYYSTADYIWNDAYWELKNPETLKGIDKLVQKGIRQISRNPGGIIIDCGYYNFSTDQVIEKINGRLLRKENQDISLDIMIVKKDKVIKVLRY